MSYDLRGSFRAAGEEVVPRGGLFGLAGFHAQAFCDVIGRNPAIGMVLSGIGRATAFAVIRSDRQPLAAGAPHLHAGLAYVPA